MRQNLTPKNEETGMQTSGKTILVVGATGQQGSATVRHLASDGWKVRAMTRSPKGAAAQQLLSAGVQVVGGEMEDLDTLRPAMDGAYGVFSVQPTVGSPGTAPDFTAADEVRWGKHVADAAHDADIAHFVFSSISGAERQTRLRPENLESKWEIEQHIYELGLPYTILRPVSFMENYTGFYYLHSGGMATALLPDVPQQVIAVDDVGIFAALAFGEPETFIGQSLEIAGDQLTPVEIARAMEAASGHPLPYIQIPMDVIRQMSPAAAVANEWLNEGGYQADIPAVRQLHPGLLDFQTWLDREGAAKIKAYLDSNQS
jgi:uncharacterized protein YbjT (DUF2867 family)